MNARYPHSRCVTCSIRRASPTTSDFYCPSRRCYRQQDFCYIFPQVRRCTQRCLCSVFAFLRPVSFPWKFLPSDNLPSSPPVSPSLREARTSATENHAIDRSPVYLREGSHRVHHYSPARRELHSACFDKAPVVRKEGRGRHSGCQ